MTRLTHMNRKQRKGYSLVEVLFASAIGAVTAGLMAYLTIFTAKSEAVLFPQMIRQTYASQGIQFMSDILRNAFNDSIVITGTTRIDFESAELPVGQIARIEIVNGEILYDEDISTGSNQIRTLARNLATGSIAWSDGQNNMVTLQVSFVYQKFTTHGADLSSQSADEQMNGTFTTKVWPRN